MNAAELVAGKDGSLVVHNAKTLEIETPLAELRDHAITPKSLLFVRNNQELPGTRTVDPPLTADWPIEIAGLVENPRTVSLEDLAKRDQVEVEMVLQCSGNGRALFGRAAKVKGAPWQHGALANVRFRGVPLAIILGELDLGVAPGAAFVTAEGRDAPPEAAAADFEHSIPLADALARSILALELNGEPLPAIHGGPVRLVTPGYYGTMHVKWLSRLRLEPRETFNHHQRRRYRTPNVPIEPGAEFIYDFDNSEANWRMRIKSVIFAPLDGDKRKAGEIEVHGVAFNDGAAAIETVELSHDDGRTWRRAELKAPSSPYAWHPWNTQLRVAKGRQRIMARAIDALGRTQPFNGAIDWNPAGYGWHGVHTVEIDVI
jgi:DMSO/TMAO reductase YedYZ molybdopterin-dependent catalytic subunit